MVRVSFIYILSLFLVLSTHGFSQEISRKSFFFEKTLNYESFGEGSTGSQIISSLSSNNITNLYWVYINVQASLLIQLNKAEVGQLSANIMLQNYLLSGETRFRDFVIDSLLMPDLIEGNLNIFYKDKLLLSQPWLLSVKAGHVRMFVPDSINLNEDQLKVELELKQFNYSNTLFNSFLHATNLINTYYAYTSVLSNMLEFYEKRALSQGQKASYLYVSWEEIQRINNYVYKYEFYNRLNLENYDPAGFLNKYDKSIRLQRRANTLKNWASRSSSTGVLEDRNDFSRGFANISQKYLELAANQQPYLAGGFSEVARIFSSEQVKDMLREASDLYDVFNNVTSANTVQSIHNNFVELAGNALTNSNYVAALDLLYNGGLLVEWFNSIKKSEQYDHIYFDAIEGLVSSYLKVATMAYRSETFAMAEIYYQKAIDVYEIHSENLYGKRLASEAFLAFIEQQTQLSYSMIDDKEYFKAIILLNKAKEISEEQHLLANRAKIDSAYRLSYLGIYDLKLDSINQLLSEHKPDEALEAMNETNDFTQQKYEYLQNVNEIHFRLLATALYKTYYEMGESMIHGKDAEKALFAFIKAKKINEKYMNEPDRKLDSLINRATVPVILDLVEKAEFEVWANRIQNANNLLSEARSIQTKYELADNTTVSEAIHGLEMKIINRHCTNLSNRCFEIEKKAENRIASKKYDEALDLLMTGKTILTDYPECYINQDKILGLLIEYEDIFYYYILVRRINAELDKKNYKEALAKLDELDKMYIVKNIRRFGVENTDVYKFVSKQNKVPISFAAANYYAGNSRYPEAFTYLELLKEQNVSAKETKSLQQNIGKGFAEKKDDINGAAKKLKAVIEGQDRWYRQLKRAYNK